MSSTIHRRLAKLPMKASANTTHTMNGAKLKPSRHVVLETHDEGTYIFRYDDDWDFSGDTWHASFEGALEQIHWEFEVAQLEWHAISEEELIALTNPEK